ncbi:MAG: HAMP domain-containing histidine kinase [Oscillibacter sp.]|uniref:HAMP domain-containing sensor histidine kinase n=1 Tax=Oscillibacter sp. TaxID=1945593 RepID=UPI0013210920|nr:HAMP domain-containing sensor histidine kinase [Oscillibacter sp.]MUU12260.1 HAMP domain-containing histidine kinase [Oscillibacter sp.]
MKKLTLQNVLRMISGFLAFFLTIGFAISCCMMLFLNVLADTMNLTFTATNIAAAAKITLVNVLLIAVIFTLVDHIRRKISVDRPVKIITDATEKFMKGDFSVRISPMQGAGSEGFNQIIIAINSMAQELSGIETLRTDFVSNVSHEMKTPLSVMQNYGTLLQGAELSQEKRIEYAKGVTDASRRMADMMTNILKLNRLENQQIFPKMEVFDLGEQLCECLLQYESVWEKANIEIETDIAEDVKVKADAELLSLVWNNLFSNAFKFTEAGGTVSVSLAATSHHAIVKVRDTGCGMTPEIGAHIFEKFYQGDTSHSTQGNGLGLALVKRVVDIMQGEINVESTVGKGTTFTVKIEKV